MRRKWLVLLLGLVVLAIGGVAAFVASSPLVRARYHLLRASPAEVRLDPDKATRLSGHALAFASSSAAKELLPDLLELARDEAARDDGVCHRALVVELTVGSARRVDWHDRWRFGRPEEAGRVRQPRPPIGIEELTSLVQSLGSRDPRLRSWTLRRLPIDERVLEVVVRRLESPALGGPSADDERGAVMGWLREFMTGTQPLVGAPEMDSGEMFPAKGWDEFFMITNPPLVYSGGMGSMKFELPESSVLARALLEWIAQNRSKLPEQVK